MYFSIFSGLRLDYMMALTIFIFKGEIFLSLLAFRSGVESWKKVFLDSEKKGISFRRERISMLNKCTKKILNVKKLKLRSVRLSKNMYELDCSLRTFFIFSFFAQNLEISLLFRLLFF